MAGMHRLGMAGISKTYGWLVPPPVTMLILSARVIRAISIDTRCATGSEWVSQGQGAAGGGGWSRGRGAVSAVVRAVFAADWTAAPGAAPAPEEVAASAASGSASA